MIFFKKEKNNACAQSVENSRVKVCGTGCSRCNELEENTREALSELGMDTGIEHIKDYRKMASYGIMSTPALVIDDEVVSVGKVLSKDEVKKILENYRQ